MSGVASQEPQALTDEALLARFQAAKTLPPSARALGFSLVAVNQAERRVEIAFEARADLLANPMGQVQGGFVCAMLDECMSVAGLVASGMTHVAPTLEMKTSFLRPVMPGPLRGVGRVVKWGRTVCFMEGELRDLEGTLLAASTGTALPTPFARFKAAASP